MKIEEFLIEQAIAIGVARRKITRIAANPNRWAKHLAPWYNDQCREAKRAMGTARQLHGKNDQVSIKATKHYLKVCL